jgi:hypothetical protein
MPGGRVGSGRSKATVERMPDDAAWMTADSGHSHVAPTAAAPWDCLHLPGGSREAIQRHAAAARHGGAAGFLIASEGDLVPP